MERIPVIPTAREELAEAVSSGPVSPPSPIACSSWLAKSLMQKSIRRGREDLALRAAATLLKDSPVRVYSLHVGLPAQAKPAPAPATEKSIPPRLSIVVLPFANIGSDPEQEHIVDGVTESLTTDLSRISGSFVIAHNTAFTFKHK